MGGQRVRRPQSAELNGTIKISVKDLLKGSQHKIDTELKIVCPTCVGQGIDTRKVIGNCQKCNGRGQIINHILGANTKIYMTCPTCRGLKKQFESCEPCSGQGFTCKNTLVEIALPPGFRGGKIQKTITSFGPHINVFYLVQLDLPNDIAIDKQGNIIKNINLKYTDLVLGKTESIEMISGEHANIKIPEKTQPSTLIRLKNKGIPKDANSTEITDMFLKINIDIPSSLTEEQVKLIEQLKTAGL
jgi:molecular chaperone DnaJ